MIRFSLNKEIEIEMQWFALPFLAGQLKIKESFGVLWLSVES